jgi:membrane associated rhomboid family serine protease
MSVTLIIIVVTVLASFYAWNNAAVLSRWIFNPYTITRRSQYDRFITSGFIHNDYGHLFFNMLTLYFFGSVVEFYFMGFFGSTIGAALYVLLYLVAIVVADIPTFFKNKDKSYYNSLGASGGVSAIVFSGIMFQPVADICLYFILCLPGFLLGALYLAYSIHKSRQPGSDNINHDAHLYGALFGILFTIIAIPRSIELFWGQMSQWTWNIF